MHIISINTWLVEEEHHQCKLSGHTLHQFLMVARVPEHPIISYYNTLPWYFVTCTVFNVHHAIIHDCLPLQFNLIMPCAENNGRDNATDSGLPLQLKNVIPGDFIIHDQVIHSAAPAGTLLAVFKCSGGVMEPNITVTRTHTLTSDVNTDNSISFDIVQDRSRRDIHYLLVNEIFTGAHQYYLISCSDGYSVFSERIAFITSEFLRQEIQPYFKSVEPRYTVSVDLDGDDVPVFEVEAEVSIVCARCTFIPCKFDIQ